MGKQACRHALHQAIARFLFALMMFLALLGLLSLAMLLILSIRANQRRRQMAVKPNNKRPQLIFLI